MAKADYRVERLALKYTIKARCVIGDKGQFRALTDPDAFELLDKLASLDALIWTPARLAEHLGISRQAVNNMIAKEQLTVIVCDSFRMSFTYIITDGEIRKSAPTDTETPLAIDPCQVCRAGRDFCTKCCKSCKDQCNGAQMCSQGEDQRKLETRARGLGLLKIDPPVQPEPEIIDDSGWKQERIPLPAAVKPSLRDLRNRAGFSRDEAKVLRAGFRLVKYVREEKKILCSCLDPMLGWFLHGISKTYAEAERRLADHLKNGLIQTNEDGLICTNQHGKVLEAAGFGLYRKEGDLPGYGTPRIKKTPGWCTWRKYESAKEVKAAWEELMQDEKALHG